jgi:hypothetical protein
MLPAALAYSIIHETGSIHSEVEFEPLDRSRVEGMSVKPA